MGRRGRSGHIVECPNIAVICGGRVYDHPSDGSPLAELVGKIGLHEHVCIIYETQNEQLAAAIPFIKIGLERGEKCLKKPALS